jgi:hypothetical protein
MGIVFAELLTIFYVISTAGLASWSTITFCLIVLDLEIDLSSGCITFGPSRLPTFDMFFNLLSVLVVLSTAVGVYMVRSSIRQQPPSEKCSLFLLFLAGLAQLIISLSKISAQDQHVFLLLTLSALPALLTPIFLNYFVAPLSSILITKTCCVIACYNNMMFYFIVQIGLFSCAESIPGIEVVDKMTDSLYVSLQLFVFVKVAQYCASIFSSPTKNCLVVDHPDHWHFRHDNYFALNHT